MKKVLLVLFMVVSIVVFVVCGVGNDNQLKDNVKDGDFWVFIKKKGVLIVGMEGIYELFIYYDKDIDKLIGYDVEVIIEVVKCLGLKVDFNEI